MQIALNSFKHVIINYHYIKRANSVVGFVHIIDKKYFVIL